MLNIRLFIGIESPNHRPGVNSKSQADSSLAQAIADLHKFVEDQLSDIEYNEYELSSLRSKRKMKLNEFKEEMNTPVKTTTRVSREIMVKQR